MKKLLPITLLLATFACTQSGWAQAQFPEASSGIKRPTPTPGAAAATTATSKKPFEASLSSDEKGKSSARSATSFPAATKKIYVHFEDDLAVKGDKLRVVWIAEDAKPYPKGKKITENASTMPGPGTIGSYYLPADGLPAGKYDAQLSVNGKVVKDLKFAVTK